MRLLVLIALGVTLASPLSAQEALPPAPYAYRQLDDSALEAQAQALMQTLRCLTCQSQSIADSDAAMAGDMRSHVRLRLAAGESPDEIRAWLTERYGDYVSYRPAMGGATWPLYAGPALLALLAALIVWRRVGILRR